MICFLILSLPSYQKRNKTPSFNFLKLLLPPQSHWYCHPSLTPGTTFSGHSLQLIPERFFFFSFDGLCRYISCPHILNLNVSLSNSQTVTLHIMDASLEISKLYPSSSPGQGFGKNIEVLSFLITTISTSPHFHQPYSLCSVLWRFWPPEINPKYCVSYLYTSNIQIIPL